MKCEVKLFKAGTVFTEEVIAVDYQDARKVALARNPGVKKLLELLLYSNEQTCIAFVTPNGCGPCLCWWSCSQRTT